MKNFKSMLLVGSLLLPLATSCGTGAQNASLSSTTDSRVAFAPEWSAYAPAMVASGSLVNIDISSAFTKRQDVLVDLLDAKGWYVGTRLTVEAGQQFVQVSLQLPATLRDPASAYFAVKVLPVGATWDKFLDQKILPVQWPVATPIRKTLYYGGKLNAWSTSFLSPVGNHGSTIVEVGKAADTDSDKVGPFQGSFAIQSFENTYYLFKTNYGLNLQTGEIFRTVIDASHSPASRTTDRLASPKTKAEMNAYIVILNGLIEAVHHNATLQQGVEWPQLKEADSYLLQVAAGLYGRFGETLKLTYESPDKLRLFTSSVNGISVSYGTAAPRDLLLDVIVAGQRVAGMRVPVGQGTGFSIPELQIPSSVKPLSQAILSIKIVPSGQPWTSKTAELNLPVVVLGINHIEWVSTQGIDTVQPGADISISGTYSGDKLMDVRADLIDANGKWLTGATFSPTLSYKGLTNYYDFTGSFKAPSNLKAGTHVTLYVKVLPLGGDWTQAVDDRAIPLKVE